MMPFSAPEILHTLDVGDSYFIETSPGTYDSDRQRFYQAAHRPGSGLEDREFSISLMRAVGAPRDERSYMLLRIERVR